MAGSSCSHSPKLRVRWAFVASLPISVRLNRNRVYARIVLITRTIEPRRRNELRRESFVKNGAIPRSNAINPVDERQFEGTTEGLTYGQTDDYSVNVTETPVHIHDLQATILNQLGIDVICYLLRVALRIPAGFHQCRTLLGFILIIPSSTQGALRNPGLCCLPPSA